MRTQATIGLAILAGAVGLAAVARAELPPGSYDALRVGAQEALIIEVESVTTKGNQPEVVASARVVAVERSKAGLKPGARIAIRYTGPGPAPPPGPRPVPILRQGRTYPAFLDRLEGAREFGPAAYGESFTMTPEDQRRPGAGPPIPAAPQ